MEFLNMTSREYQAMISGKKSSKYGAEKTEYDGRVYDSKKESKRAVQLNLWQKMGVISNLEMQKKFVLVEPFEYRGEKIRGVSWIADFYYQRQDGVWVAEDVKSVITRKKPEYVIKKKLFMIKYPEIMFNEYT